MLEDLKDGACGYGGTTWRRFGSKLVVVELAIAMVLMVSAGLLSKSLYLLLHVDTGFTPEHLALLQLSWPPASYVDDQQKIVLQNKIMDRLSMLSGVKSVALSNA